MINKNYQRVVVFSVFCTFILALMIFFPFNSSVQQYSSYFRALNNYWNSRNFVQSRKMSDFRKWIKVWHEPDCNRPLKKFKLMSYNVLSQTQLERHRYLYAEHDSDNLVWEKRWSLMLNEIKYHNSDIICFQELDALHFNSHFNKDLKQLGYRGIFKKRTGDFPDGCAIYFKYDLLHLEDFHNVEFFQSKLDILSRNNVGIIAKFSFKNHTNSNFVVATTHLLFNPKRGDIRFAQMFLFLAEIERFAYEKTNSQKIDEYLPIILTGDFNEPRSMSIYNFLKFQKLYYGNNLYQNWKKLGITDYCRHVGIEQKRNQTKLKLDKTEQIKYIEIDNSEFDNTTKVHINTEENNYKFFTGMFQHPFQFDDLSRFFPHPNSMVSTFHTSWTLVDFIFFSYTGFQLASYYSLPNEEHLLENKIIFPDNSHGSDHLPLLVNFILK